MRGRSDRRGGWFEAGEQAGQQHTAVGGHHPDDWQGKAVAAACSGSGAAGCSGFGNNVGEGSLWRPSGCTGLALH